ncbi:Protein regulator of cytokinesi 1 [Taenia crassiceps]|uniref:Protein regulator of cytokinesi 1 n=1 Tax=Taenia crassiceps TaxID=6207 RepID=A0ABR4QM73_9CEST
MPVGGGSSSRPSHSAGAVQSFPPLSRTALSNEDWVDYLVASLREKVDHILKIWDDIGLDEKPYKERKCILKRHLEMLLDNMISEEERSVTHLRSVVNEMEVKVSKLNCILGLKEKPLQQNLPLIVRERNLAEAYKHLSVMVSSRIDRFRSLVTEHQRLSKALGRPPKHYTYDYAPSPQLLEAIEHDINELLIKLAQRYAETCNHKIPNQVIESDATAGKNADYTSSSICDENSTNTNTSTFLSLKKRVVALRDPMQTDRLKEAIRSNLTDLHKLFDECLVDPCIRELYPLEPSESSFDEVYLEHLENQIKDWQDYRTLHTDAIAAFYSWRASFARLIKVEDQLCEAKNLTTRSKDLLKLEREATSIRERILPQLENLLFSVARRSDNFKIFGLPAKVYVEEARREADQAPPGTQRLSPGKQTQLLSKSLASLRTPNPINARNHSRKSILKPNQIPHPDRNQSASAVLDSVVPIDRKSTNQKTEWPNLGDKVGASGFLTAPSRRKAAAPSRLRAPRVMVGSAPTTPGLSISCGRMKQLTPRALRPLADSSRQVSVVDLFVRGGGKLTQISSALKTPIGSETPLTKKTVSRAYVHSSLDDVTSSRWGNNEDINLGAQLASPTSVKSDSIFATPIGRAPMPHKKGTTTPHISASCSCLNRLAPLFEESPRPISVVDLFRPQHYGANRLTPMTTTVENGNEKIPAPKKPMVLGWQAMSDRTNLQDASSDRPINLGYSSSSVLASNQSASPTSIKSETVFATPVGRAPLSRRQKDGLRTVLLTQAAATPSRLRTPRVVGRTTAVTPTPSSSCSRLDLMTPRALPLTKESPRSISVVEFFRHGGKHDVTNGTPSNKWRTRGLKTPNNRKRP